MEINDPARQIVHMDLDSFFVSVECLEHTPFKGKPLIIGGNSDRGVVASCSYEARKFGVHSAMSARVAKRLCPQAIWLQGDMGKYSKYSRLVTDIIKDKSPLYEKASIDEFYIDLSGMDKFFGCFKWTQELKQYILKESGLTISFGLSVNKTVSKIATGESKPNGQKQVISGTEKPFLNPLPIRKIPGTGPKTSNYLNNLGIARIGTLAEMPVRVLESLFGKSGIILWQKANAIDDTPVIPFSERKSISTEQTFATDTIDIRFIHSVLTRMVEEVAFKMRGKAQLTGCITLKIKYSSFDIVNRQETIAYTSNDDILIKKAKDLFDKLYDRRLLIRLIGVRFSNLVRGHQQINLFEDTEETVKLMQALDKIKKKFGETAVGRSSGINGKKQ
jgi:DNA polymerase-4